MNDMQQKVPRQTRPGKVRLMVGHTGVLFASQFVMKFLLLCTSEH